MLLPCRFRHLFECVYLNKETVSRRISAMTTSRQVRRMLGEGIVHGDAAELLPPGYPKPASISSSHLPPYADARAYSRIHPPDHYVDWFLPYAKEMLAATTETGSMIINIKKPRR